MRKSVAKFLRKNTVLSKDDANYKRSLRAAKRHWNATPRNKRAKLKEELS